MAAISVADRDDAAPSKRRDIRLIIITKVRLYREGLQIALAHQPFLEVVGATPDHFEAVDKVQSLRPEVALLGLSVPEGPALARNLLRVDPDVRVVALAVSEVEQDVIAWAEAGISGYVAQDGSMDDLVATIKSVLRGEMLCSPRVAATLLRHITSLATGHSPPQAVTALLTRREAEIVRLIDQGSSNKEIAQRLSIALPTVKNHVHNILEKLQVRRRWEVVQRLSETEPPPGRASSGVED